MSNEELVREIQQGHNEYLAELYQRNLPLIKKFVMPYVSDMSEMEDYLQQSYFAVLDAIKGFNADLGCKFTTYLQWHIKRTMQGYKVESALVRIPYHLQEKIAKYKKAYAELCAEYEREPTKEEVFAFTGLSESEQGALIPLMNGYKSLDAELETAEGDSVSLLEMVSSGEDMEENTVDALYKENMRSEIWMAVRDNISEMESDVIILRFLCNLTLQKIADKKGLTRERIRQQEAAAIRHLRMRCKRLLEGYAEADGLLYHSGFSTFKYRQESVVERVASRHMEIEERYKRMLQEEQEKFQKRIKKG